MSGTSLDGLDIAYCKFSYWMDWSFEILYFNTINYDSVFREKLRRAPFQKESDIKKLSYEFGCLMANELKQFVNRYAITEIDAVRATHDYREVGVMNPNIKSQIAYNVQSKIIETVRTNGVLMTQVTPQGGVIS